MLEEKNVAPPGTVIDYGWIVVDETDNTFLGDVVSGGRVSILFSSPVEAANLLYRKWPVHEEGKLRIKKVRLHDTGRWDLVEAG